MEQIKNNKLTVTVSKHGAELQSIKDANGKSTFGKLILNSGIVITFFIPYRLRTLGR